MKKLILALITITSILSALPSFAETATATAIVNVNTATREQLMDLPGIGEAKADAIIAQRQVQPFAKKEDLLLVKGIGEKILEKLSPQVQVGNADTKTSPKM